MRASTNGISSVRFAFGCQAASWRTCSSVTFLPSQFLSTDSGTMRVDTGSLSSFNPQSLKHGKLYSLPGLGKALNLELERLPGLIRLVLEAVVRKCDGEED